MRQKEKELYMRMAHEVSRMSYCQRRQVGCIVVLANGMHVIGYNGTPAGEDNCCEDHDGITKANVVHAESNALNKIPLDEDLSTATLFVTLSPCIPCAVKIVERGVGSVVYHEKKNTLVGLDHLLHNNVAVQQLTPIRIKTRRTTK